MKKKISYKKRIIIKRALFGSMASVVLVNQIPMQYVYAIEDRSVNNEFKLFSPDIIDVLNYGEGDKPVNEYEGTVKLEISFKLKDKEKPDGPLIAKVKYYGNSVGEFWTGKTRWSLSMPKGFKFINGTLATTINNDRKVYKNLSDWVNEYGRDFASGLKLEANYKKYVTPWNEDEDFGVKYKSETDNLFTVKYTGGISSGSKFTIEYEAEVPADMRGKKMTVVGAFKKNNLGRYQRDVAYIYNVPAVPEDKGTKDADKLYVAPIPVRLNKGESLYNISAGSKSKIMDAFLATNRDRQNGVRQGNVELEYKGDRVIVKFKDGSQLEDTVRNFAKEYVETPVAPSGRPKDYDSNTNGIKYRVLIPEKYTVDDPNKVRGTNESNAQIKDEVKEVVTRLGNSNNDYTINQHNNDAYTKFYKLKVKKVVNGSEQGTEIFTTAKEAVIKKVKGSSNDSWGFIADYTDNKVYKDLDMSNKIRFYKFNSESYGSDGEINNNYDRNNYFDLPIRDLIANPAEDKSAANKATEGDKKFANNIIDDLKNLTQQEKEALKQRVNAQSNNTEVDKIVQEANTKNAEKAKAKAVLDTAKSKAKNKISGSDSSKNEFPNLTEENVKQLKSEIENARDQGAIDKIIEKAKAQDLSNKKNNAINELKTYPDEIKNKYTSQLNQGNKTKEQIDKILSDARLEKEKYEAKKRIDEALLNHPKYSQDEINQVKQSIDRVTNPGDANKLADALIKKMVEKRKPEVKKELDKLLEHTNTETKNLFKDALDKAKNDSEINSILDSAKTVAKLEKAKQAIDNLQYLNNAQKDALKSGLEPGISSKELQDILDEARKLDNTMKALNDIKNKVKDYQKTGDYTGVNNKQAEKQQLEEALKTAEDALNKATGGYYSKQGVDELIDDIVNKLNKVKPNSGIIKEADKIEYTALEDAVNEGDAIKASDAYKHEKTKAKKDEYDQALTEAKAILAEVKKSKPTKTQEDVDNALAKLSKAKDMLNGIAPASTTLTIKEATQSYDKSAKK